MVTIKWKFVNKAHNDILSLSPSAHMFTFSIVSLNFLFFLCEHERSDGETDKIEKNFDILLWV